MQIRHPVVAGRFYPADRDECLEQIRECLASRPLTAPVVVRSPWTVSAPASVPPPSARAPVWVAVTSCGLSLAATWASSLLPSAAMLRPLTAPMVVRSP